MLKPNQVKSFLHAGLYIPSSANIAKAGVFVILLACVLVASVYYVCAMFCSIEKRLLCENASH